MLTLRYFGIQFSCCLSDAVHQYKANLSETPNSAKSYIGDWTQTGSVATSPATGMAFLLLNNLKSGRLFRKKQLKWVSWAKPKVLAEGQSTHAKPQSVQMVPLSRRDHPAVCTLVPALRLELSGLGRVVKLHGEAMMANFCEKQQRKTGPDAADHACAER